LGMRKVLGTVFLLVSWGGPGGRPPLQTPLDPAV
jgi:hypothetical protein